VVVLEVGQYLETLMVAVALVLVVFEQALLLALLPELPTQLLLVRVARQVPHLLQMAAILFFLQLHLMAAVLVEEALLLLAMDQMAAAVVLVHIMELLV